MPEKHLLNTSLLLPIVYLGSITYYSALLDAPATILEKHEHFIKQTYRNRCLIAGPNGKQMLVIPVEKGKTGHSPVKDVRICYNSAWQKIHWRSLEAGYRRSPYFEFYEDDLHGLYEEKEKFLVDFNLKLHEKIMKWLKEEKTLAFTGSYEKVYAEIRDCRNGWKEEDAKEYIQVFSARNGFIQGLSVVDLIFNEGPRSISYLKG
ncbi:MAG: WbqC family protein [Flavobacteriales bacterium]